MRTIGICLLFLLSGCIDLQKATDFNELVSAAVGEDVSLETDEDTALNY